MTLYKVFALPILSVFLYGCNYPLSFYKASQLVNNNNGIEADIEFESLKGTYCFSLKKTSPGEGSMFCFASLQEGTIKVSLYQTLLNGKFQLFTINGGETFSDYRGYVETKQKYIIVIESEDVSKIGKFTFNIN